MDPGEESFTLSSFDFRSSFALYSSDEDEELNKTNKDDTDAYIELELPPPAMASPPLLSEVAESDDGDGDKEHDFRISFSAIVPFPGFSPSSIDSAIVVSSKPSFSTCDDANTQMIPISAIDSSPEPVVKSTLSCIHRSAVSIFPLDWSRFPPPIDENCRRPVSDINGWELVPSRKSSGAGNGGITKLLVKLRSIVISGLGSMRASLAQAGIGTSRRGLTPSERWLTLCEPQQQTTAVRINGGEMKFETVRKLFGSAMKSNNGLISKSGRLNKSCPTSIKSSPVHQSGDASLVNAAIAHCKKSFGQNEDFSF